MVFFEHPSVRSSPTWRARIDDQIWVFARQNHVVGVDERLAEAVDGHFGVVRLVRERRQHARTVRVELVARNRLARQKLFVGIIELVDVVGTSRYTPTTLVSNSIVSTMRCEPYLTIGRQLGQPWARATAKTPRSRVASQTN